MKLNKSLIRPILALFIIAVFVPLIFTEVLQKTSESAYVTKPKKVNNRPRRKRVSMINNPISITLPNSSQQKGFNFGKTVEYITNTSKILKEEDVFKIRKWMPIRNFTVSLCYSSELHPKTPLAFHKRCDKNAPTLMIAQASTYFLFGGYTSIAWGEKKKLHSSNGNEFIFSLTRNKKLPIKNKSEAIENDPNKFPCFGHHPGNSSQKGQDIFLPSDVFKKFTKVSWLDSYQSGIKKENRKTFLTGKEKVKIRKLEVYVIQYPGSQFARKN